MPRVRIPCQTTKRRVCSTYASPSGVRRVKLTVQIKNNPNPNPDPDPNQMIAEATPSSRLHRAPTWSSTQRRNSQPTLPATEWDIVATQDVLDETNIPILISSKKGRVGPWNPDRRTPTLEP